MKKMSTKIASGTKSLIEEIRQSSDILYLTILGLYVLSRISVTIAWVNVPGFSGYLLKQSLTIYMLVFLGIYLGSIFFLWIHKRWAIFPILAVDTGFLFMCARMRRPIFEGVMICVLILCAFGKPYKRILQVMIGCIGTSVIVAGIGVLVGYTRENPKVGAYGTGFALGFTHPNFWGIYTFFLLLLIWYLLIQRKSKSIQYVYYAFSWLLGVFMVFVPKCRTEALLAFLFPIVSIISKLILCPAYSEDKRKGHRGFINVLIWIMILSPVICFFLTIILGQLREWLVVHTFGTYIENFSKRFIQSGLALKEHGLPLFGELIRFNSGLSEELGGYTFILYIMDNAYLSYAILRGMIWLVPILAWLCYAGWKAVKEKNYALLTAAVMFSLLGLMERYALDIYNFVLLYPLTIAAVNRSPGDHNYQREITGETKD